MTALQTGLFPKSMLVMIRVKCHGALPLLLKFFLGASLCTVKTRVHIFTYPGTCHLGHYLERSAIIYEKHQNSLPSIEIKLGVYNFRVSIPARTKRMMTNL